MLLSGDGVVKYERRESARPKRQVRVLPLPGK